MLLSYWQLATTDPLESKSLKVLVEQLQDDKTNEALRIEIRKLDLMARNAYFSSQWQLRSGAYLLIAGVIITIISLRIYFAARAEILPPESTASSLDTELMITRKWVLYTISFIFGLAIIASFLSIDHLSRDYTLIASSESTEEVPVQEITPIQNDEGTNQSPPEAETNEDAGETDEEKVSENEDIGEVTEETVPEAASKSDAVYPDISIIKSNYPGFRGPMGNGVSTLKNIPVSWNGATGENIRWKTPVELPGYSSPVIWEDQLFITGADELNQSLYCYSTVRGELLWEHKVIVPRASVSIEPTEDTGFAAPSAATDGRYVVAIFATGDIACTDMIGTEVWSKNVGVPDNHYGHSSSLLIWKNLVLVQFDTNESGKVFAIDVRNGNLVWEQERASEISWASPILANVEDHYELILASSPDVAGYDPETGKELWTLDCLSGEVGPSPAYNNGVVFTANEYAKLTAFIPGNPPTVLWDDNEYLPEVSSPVAVNDLLFIGTSYGVIACYRSKTGELLWEYECNRGFYESPIVADGKVYFIDRGGKMYIFSASESLSFINDPELGEETFASPAFSDGQIFIRANENLYCIGS